MSRRTLHIIDSLDYNGSAGQLLLLAQGLRRQGFDVHVCAFDRRAPRVAEFLAAGIPTTVIPLRWSLDPLADWQLARYVRRHRKSNWTIHGTAAGGRVAGAICESS